MDKPHRRKLKDIVSSICENVSNYVTQLEEQNTRTKLSQNRLNHLTTVDEFKVTKIKMTMATTDSSWIEKCRVVKSKLDEKNVY